MRVASEDLIIRTVQEMVEEDFRASENVYLGGVPDYEPLLENARVGFPHGASGFIGCILGLRINERKIALEALPFGSIIQGINLGEF